MKYILILLFLIVSCNNKNPEINPTDPTPTPVVVEPTPKPAVNEHCLAEGKKIECEAQFATMFPCRKADDSDYAPAYFKDIEDMDSWGKANTVGFQMGTYPNVKYYGWPGALGFGWHCKEI